NETAAAWLVALEQRHRPTALALTRQKLPILDLPPEMARTGLRRGGYVLAEASGGKPDLILLATGSEVHLALAARPELERQGVAALGFTVEAVVERGMALMERPHLVPEHVHRGATLVGSGAGPHEGHS